MTDSQARVREAVQRWYQRFVLDLKLCPFAVSLLAERDTQALRIECSSATSEQALLEALGEELVWLREHDNVETTLLVHPDVLTDFLDYNDFLDLADELLRTSSLDGVFQIASFHPRYQFAGTAENAPENYANRSPYPLLHILREDSVSAAVERHPDVDLIVRRNAEVLAALGADGLMARWQGCLTGSADE